MMNSPDADGRVLHAMRAAGRLGPDRLPEGLPDQLTDGLTDDGLPDRQVAGAPGVPTPRAEPRHPRPARAPRGEAHALTPEGAERATALLTGGPARLNGPGRAALAEVLATLEAHDSALKRLVTGGQTGTQDTVGGQGLHHP